MRYKSILSITIVTLLFLAYSSYALSPKTQIEQKQEFYQVLRIVDGDTIVVSYNGKKEHIRLLRINTPEKKQDGYKQAKKAMEKLVKGKRARLEFEHTLERGKYGRILAYIWVDDMNVNVGEARMEQILDQIRGGEVC